MVVSMSYDVPSFFVGMGRICLVIDQIRQVLNSDEFPLSGLGDAFSNANVRL